MPLTLYRYILWELIKLLVVSTTVLLVVISFAGAMKPMNEGLLGPVGLVKFVLYSAPTMMTFALPFGAAFASTVLFLRMATDNEILVCRASGMSYPMILAPVIMVGSVLLLGQLYLDNFVIPRFYKLAEAQLEHDMTRFMVAQVQKRQPVTFSHMNTGMILYADSADDTQPPPGIRSNDPSLPKDGKDELVPNKLVILKGVAIALRDSVGHVKVDGTAEQADLLLYHINGRSYVTVQLERVMYYHAERNEFAFVENWNVPPMELPNLFHDRMQFFSLTQMRDLAKYPERFDKVEEKVKTVVDRMAVERLVRKVEDLTGKGRPVTFNSPVSGQKFRLTSPRIQRWGPTIDLGDTKDKKVIVEVLSGDKVTRRMEADAGSIHIESGDPDLEPRAKIDLKNVTVYDLFSDKGTQRDALTLPRSFWPQPVAGPLSDESPYDLRTEAVPYLNAEPVASGVKLMNDEMVRLGRKINAELHQRAAAAVSAVMVLFFGAVLSMLMKGSTPLVVFFWVFVLATIVVIITHSGTNMIADPGQNMNVSIAVAWSGNMLLFLVNGFFYLKLTRN